MNYTVDLESLHRNFPDGFAVPSLLLEFGNWLKSKQVGSVGYFSLQSERFSDYWIENGADLHPRFAFFIRDPTGGQIGYWLYDGPSTAWPPVVMVGSEGELATLSDNLEEFLQRVAAGNTLAPDLDTRDRRPDENAELAQWAGSRPDATPIRTQRNHPDIKTWMDEWGRQQRESNDSDPLHLQIADKLRKFVKPNAQPWETANFDVLLVGTRFQMWHRSFGPKPMPPGDMSELERLFRTVREQRAHRVPERGLWFSSWVRVGLHGGAYLCCDFMDEPRISGQRLMIARSDYERDLAIFPRSRHWTPAWLCPAGQS
jgi:hypothetical protein